MKNNYFVVCFGKQLTVAWFYFLEGLLNGWLNRRQLDSHSCYSFILFPYMVLDEAHEENPSPATVDVLLWY